MQKYTSENYTNFSKKDFLSCPAVGYDALANQQPLEIIDFIHDINDMIIVRSDSRTDPKIHIVRLNYQENDASFRIDDKTYLLSQFCRYTQSRRTESKVKALSKGMKTKKESEK